MPHILLNAACDLKFLSDSTCTNLWSYSSLTPCLSYIRYMYTDYAYCINLSWIKYMYICVFANKVAGNRELNYKHWQLFWLKHSRFNYHLSVFQMLKKCHVYSNLNLIRFWLHVSVCIWQLFPILQKWTTS